MASLEALTVADALRYKAQTRGTKNSVIMLEHSQTVASALKVLAAHRILSAPMVVSPGLEDMEEMGDGEATPGPSLIGWVDITDILRSLLDQLHTKRGAALPTAMLALMSDLESVSPAFSSRSLISLKGGEDKSLVYQGEMGAPLLATIRDCFLNNAGQSGRVVHRLAVFDAQGQIHAVLSQLDVVSYLAAHPELLGPAAQCSMAQLGLLPSGPGHVVCLEPHVPTLLSLEKLLAAGVSGGAVVAADGSGALIANLSISDLRCIQPDQLGVLALPVAEFLAVLHNTSYLGYSQKASAQASNPFFACGPRSASRQLSGRRGHPGALQAAEPASNTPPPPSRDPSAASPLPPASPPAPGLMLPPSSPPPSTMQPLSPRPRSSSSGLRSALAGVDEAEVDDSVRCLTCDQHAQLHAVLHMFADNHVHRVYVLDPAARPQVSAVLTPTDILRWLVTHGPAAATPPGTPSLAPTPAPTPMAMV